MFKKTELHYVAAVAPVVINETRSVPTRYLEKLDRAIAKRIEQNNREMAAGISYLEEHDSIYYNGDSTKHNVKIKVPKKG